MTPLHALPINTELLHILVQQGVMFAETLPAFLARLAQEPNQTLLNATQLQQLHAVMQSTPLDAMHDAEGEPMTFGVLDEQLKQMDGSAKIDLTDVLGGEHDR
jgi:hypothetical protein